MPKEKRNSTHLGERILYFFPIQLLLVHLKKNQQLLFFWLILFLIIFKKIGLKYGLPYLFLAPEYLGRISISSFAILGFAVGGFVIAFNISSYIMNGFRFPFLATLSKPFLKYSINNATIPLVFLSCYSLLTFHFLTQSESLSPMEAVSRILGFFGGYATFVIISMTYFLATNKSFEKIFGKELSKVLRNQNEEEETPHDLLSKKEKNWFSKGAYEKSKRVDSYIGGRLQLKSTRSFAHYDRKMLSQVFRQNHLNASVFELVIILSIFLLGYFREQDFFNIPASSTIVLVFTMLLMVTSAIRSWMKGWTFISLVGVLLLINQCSKYDQFYYENRAYGLDYSVLSEYPIQESRLRESELENDYNLHLQMLNAWKAKNKDSNSQKPLAVFIATSGGGSRAAYWSFLALQHLDSLTDGELLKHNIMTTGSSGGMIGAAYYRELALQSQLTEINAFHPRYQDDLSKDLLNPVVFNMFVNDVIIRTHSYEYDGYKHWKDRGYTFEKTLHKHTRGMLEKRLGDYRSHELKADIPTLIFSPSIVNDSKRLLISSLPLSFLTKDEIHASENIDYQQLFHQNKPLNTRFSSVLRMNSSFPYIMPTVDLPTDPEIEVFDSGLRDNYGIKLSSAYIHAFKTWLSENTSGILILQLRDGLKSPTKANFFHKKSVLDEVLSPFGSLYGNWFEVQDYNNDELLRYMKSWYPGKLKVLDYQLNKSPDNYISLSWHLTSEEKHQIKESLKMETNKNVAQEILELLK